MLLGPGALTLKSVLADNGGVLNRAEFDVVALGFSARSSAFVLEDGGDISWYGSPC